MDPDFKPDDLDAESEELEMESDLDVQSTRIIKKGTIKTTAGMLSHGSKKLELNFNYKLELSFATSFLLHLDFCLLFDIWLHYWLCL